MIPDLLLIWTFWVNVTMATSEDLAWRKAHPKPRFADWFAQSSTVDILMMPVWVALLLYVIARWFHVAGTCGQTELLLYRWLADRAFGAIATLTWV